MPCFASATKCGSKFAETLRRRQACRPNRMRRTQQEAQHDPPFLENLIVQANQCIQALQNFDIRRQFSLNREACRALEQLWNIFQNLCYHGRERNGLADVVGISKAVLLLTEGRVGPAFDSNVRGHLQILEPLNASSGLIRFKKYRETFWHLKLQTNVPCKKLLLGHSQVSTAGAFMIWHLALVSKNWTKSH